MAVNTAHAKVACQINDLASVRVGGSLIKGTPKEALYFKPESVTNHPSDRFQVAV